MPPGLGTLLGMVSETDEHTVMVPAFAVWRRGEETDTKLQNIQSCVIAYGIKMSCNVVIVRHEGASLDLGGL